MEAMHKSMVELSEGLDTDKESRHAFLRFYDCLFSPVRDSARAVLEVGIHTGGSLELWRRYFSSAMIYGVDVKVVPPPADSRIRHFQFDQDDEVAWGRAMAEVGRPLDVVVEDGNHMMASQQRTFEIVFPQVVSGGLYILEDLHTSFPELGWGCGSAQGMTTMAMLQQWQRSGSFDGCHVRDSGRLAKLVASMAVYGRRDSLTAAIRRV